MTGKTHDSSVWRQSTQQSNVCNDFFGGKLVSLKKDISRGIYVPILRNVGSNVLNTGRAS